MELLFGRYARNFEVISEIVARYSISACLGQIIDVEHEKVAKLLQVLIARFAIECNSHHVDALAYDFLAFEVNVHL